MHGGFIAAQSEGEGHGTEFYFDLPLVKQAKYTKSGKLRAVEDLENILEEESSQHEEGDEEETEADPADAQIDEIIKKQRQPGKSFKATKLPTAINSTASPDESTPQTLQQASGSQNQPPNVSWWTLLTNLFSGGKGSRIYSEELRTTEISTVSRSRENTVKGAMNSFLNYPVKMLVRKLKKPSPESVDAADEDLENGIELPDSVMYIPPQLMGDNPDLTLNDIENQNSQSDYYNPENRVTTPPDFEMNDNILYHLSSPQNDLVTEKVQAPSVTTHIITVNQISNDIQHREHETSANSSESEQIIKIKPDWNAGISILLVDDADSNRKMCRRFLTAQKHNVTEAKDGLDCLRVYDEAIEGVPKGQEPFDLILMDDNMPNLLGYETAKKLRERGFKGIIIGVTGDIYPENIERFTSNGANDVLGKPLNVPKLKERFAQLTA
jgi:CheY-like chemotaxis protein